MHIDTFIDIETLRRVVAQSAPIRLLLGEGRWVELGDPREVELREGRLNLRCSGRFRWTALDVPVTFTLRDLQTVLSITIVDDEKLALGIEFRGVDIAHIPSVVERHMIRKVNEALVPEKTRLMWSVREALRYIVQLPDKVPTHEEFRLEAGALTLLVEENGILFRVSLLANLFRALERTKEELRLAPEDEEPPQEADDEAKANDEPLEDEPRAIRFIF